MRPTSFPASAFDTRTAECRVSVPFGRYQLTLHNPTLSGLGGVSHFLLQAAAQYQGSLQPLLSSLGLDELQAEPVIRRLTQLSLLKDNQELTPQGAAMADFLASGLQASTATLWIEQLDLPFDRNLQPQIRLSDAGLFIPATQNDAVLLPHLSGPDTSAQQKMVVEQARRPDQQAWLQSVFPKLPLFTHKYPEFQLDVSLTWDREIRYQPLPVPMPGRNPLWQPLTDQKPFCISWPLICGQRIYTDPVSGQTRSAEQVYGCLWTGTSLPEAVPHDDAQGPIPSEQEQWFWLNRLQQTLPAEAEEMRLCNRKLSLQVKSSYWQPDLNLVRQRLNTAKQP